MIDIKEIEYKDVLQTLKRLSITNKGIVILGIDKDDEVLTLIEKIHHIFIASHIFPNFTDVETTIKEAYFFFLPMGRKDLVLVFNELPNINLALLEIWKKEVTGVCSLEKWSPSYDGRP